MDDAGQGQARRRSLFFGAAPCVPLVLAAAAQHLGFSHRDVALCAILFIFGVFLAFGRWMAPDHAHAVREILQIFAIAFVGMTGFGIVAHESGAFDGKGNAVTELGRAFLWVVRLEGDLAGGVKAALGLFVALVAADAVAFAMTWSLGVQAPAELRWPREHVLFGVYVSYSDDPRRLPRISFRPTKFLTVLLMKCCCAAFAVSAALAVLVLVLYPQYASGSGVDPLGRLYAVGLLGAITLAATLINETVLPAMDAVVMRLQNRRRC